MSRITQSRQRGTILLAIVAIVLSLTLAACGTHASASSGSSTPTNAVSAQQPQSGQSTQSDTDSSSIQGTDQQVQSILKSLNDTQNDINNSDAAASQDNGQQP
jgi:ABC-type oligopeptide transport system substrate-binding subunit